MTRYHSGIHPVQSNVCSPEALQWASDRAADLSERLRSLASGRQVQSVNLTDTTVELVQVRDAIADLWVNVLNITKDARDQRDLELPAVRHTVRGT